MITPADRVLRVRAASRRGAPVASRPDTIALSVGEPDFITPQPVLDAMTAAVTDGWTHYAAPDGLPALRECIAQALAATHNVPLVSTDVIVTHGGSAGITSTMLALIGPGDVVVVPDPGYSLYVDAVALAGGRVVAVPADMSDEAAVVTAFLAAVNEHGANMLVLCNPVNPTGAVFTADGLSAIATGLEGTACVVLSDEAYQDFQYRDGFSSALAIASLRSRLIFCQTFSKSFAMTGWRIGYLVAPAHLLAPIALVHRTMNGPLNTAGQIAAIAALDTRAETIPQMLGKYVERRAIVLAGLREIPGLILDEPAAAFYVFFSYPHDVVSTRLQEILSAEYGIGLRAGSEFGDNGEYHLRLSYAYDPATLRAGLTRLKDAFAALDARFPFRVKHTSRTAVAG